MKISLTLPKLSATMEEATIVKWLKDEGETVEEGDILYELETDKATLEVDSTHSGILEKILVEPGVPIPVGTPVCEISTSSQNDQSVAKNNSNENMEKDDTNSISHSIKNKGWEAEQKNQDNGSESIKELTIRVSPSARRLAKELNVDLRLVKGTGPKGRILNRDVERAAQLLHSTRKEAQMEKDLQAEKHVQTEKDVQKESTLNNPQAVPKMRLAIAKELLRSTQNIPSFWVEKWVNAEKILKWKELLTNLKDSSLDKITITDFVLQAMGLALEEMPSVNRRWIEISDKQIVIEPVPGNHVGLAISVEGGVIAPVLTDVGSLSLVDISKKRIEAIEAVRNNRPYSTNQPAAITLSNLGSTGIDRFRAIIKPDESMILALGGLQEKPVVENGRVVVQRGFSMVLSADHRLIDGMEAAKYLAAVARIIETGNWKFI
jgi:pyruvate dehydrogenase E2 component (dihydrolipoamide acetyltransferase)